MSHFSFLRRLLAAFLAALLVMPAAQAAQAAQSAPLPDAPQTQDLQPASAALHPEPAQQASQSVQSDAAQPGAQSSPPSPPADPVGTAAAPTEKPVGSTGSAPAGAVIAPAKQRRVRTFLISIAVIVGAGVAVGTVAALSHGSPSQPR